MKVINRLKEKAENIHGSSQVTLAFLGDSVTQGCFDVYMQTETTLETYFDSENAYHTQVRKILNMMYPKAPVNIINAGISGGCASAGLDRLERDVLRYSPDLCVVCFGLNDSCVSDIETYTKSLRDIFTRLQQEQIEVIFMTPNMMCTEVSCHIKEPYIRQVAANISAKETDGTLEKFLCAAKDVARECNVPVCDCYSKWKIMNNSGVQITNLLANYINHPTPQMNWMFAYSLVETMFLN